MNNEKKDNARNRMKQYGRGCLVSKENRFERKKEIRYCEDR